MKCVSVKSVPKLLPVKQKQTYLEVARYLLKTITAGDEPRDYGYDPKTKALSSQWKTPRSPRSNKKSTPSSEQGESDVDSFLLSRRCHLP